jgi:hypothetical protein
LQKHENLLYWKRRTGVTRTLLSCSNIATGTKPCSLFLSSGVTVADIPAVRCALQAELKPGFRF